MKSHWNTRYILDRTREWIFHRTHPRAPWLGPAAVQLFHELLIPHFIGLEAGAGRSTTWIARRVRQLVTLEENEAWMMRVRRAVARARLQNVTLQTIAGTGEDRIESYRSIIAGVPDEGLDFAFVDSEHDRDVVALALLPKLKPGGFLVLDNANWFLPSDSRSPASRRLAEGGLNDQWHRFELAVQSWEKNWTSSGVTDTAFFFKPSND